MLKKKKKKKTSYSTILCFLPLFLQGPHSIRAAVSVCFQDKALDSITFPKHLFWITCQRSHRYPKTLLKLWTCLGFSVVLSNGQVQSLEFVFLQMTNVMGIFIQQQLCTKFLSIQFILLPKRESTKQCRLLGNVPCICSFFQWKETVHSFTFTRELSLPALFLPHIWKNTSLVSSNKSLWLSSALFSHCLSPHYRNFIQ